MADAPAVHEDVIAALTRHHEGKLQRDFDGQPEPKRAKRGLHHKGHGVVRATVRIADDLPAALQVGVFVPGARYAAWARFSTASFSAQSARLPDVHGLAIKLIGVPDAPRASAFERHTQDFVMMDSPRLMVADAAQSLAFDRAKSGGNLSFLWHLLTHPREALALRAVSSTPAHLFERAFNSITPFAHGPDVVVRYVVGLAPDQTLPALTPDDTDLRATLARHLSAGDLRLTLGLQVRDGQPLDDARVDWASDPVVAATVTLHAAGFGDYERLGERMSFNPWNALEAHRPLGGLNAARHVVYGASYALRNRLNGESSFEPTGDAGAP